MVIRCRGELSYSGVYLTAFHSIFPEDPETHQITDFFSFYSLPSTVIGNQKHPILEAAYLFYYATTVAFESDAEDDGRLKARVQALITDAFAVAGAAKFDVFNALTLMDNANILQDLKVHFIPTMQNIIVLILNFAVWAGRWVFKFLSLQLEDSATGGYESGG
jgi:hypothetical protein